MSKLEAFKSVLADGLVVIFGFMMQRENTMLATVRNSLVLSACRAGT
jgi:hypothetical protein